MTAEPQGWAGAVVADLLDEPMVNGHSVPSSPDGFPVLRISAVRDGRIDLTVRKTGAWTQAEASQYLVKQGDFFVVRGNGSLNLVGRGGVVDDEPDPVAFPDTLIRLRFNPALVTREWVAWAWKSFQIRKQIEEFAHTTAGIYKISQKEIARIIVPIPPLSEQRRIVARLVVLLADIERVRDRLEGVAATMQRFRQAVLAAALDGRLTAGWREADTGPWSTVTLVQCGTWVGGVTPSKAQDAYWANGTIPWVTPKDMKRDVLPDSIDHITERALDESTVHLFPPGSVIFVVRGMILARDFPVAIVERSFTINQDMRGVIPNDRIDGRFLMYALKRDRNNILGLVKFATHGTKRIESPDLKKWIIPLPQLPEQHEIVRRVEALFALADRIEGEVAVARERVETLTQALLAKAFLGELVPTEAEIARCEEREYEPAGALLERVREERQVGRPRPAGRPRRSAGQTALPVE